MRGRLLFVPKDQLLETVNSMQTDFKATRVPSSKEEADENESYIFGLHDVAAVSDGGDDLAGILRHGRRR